MVAAFPLTPGEARQKRDELVNDGFTVIRNVMPAALLSEFRECTSQLFEEIKVDGNLRYQGSSQFFLFAHANQEALWMSQGTIRSWISSVLNLRGGE
jgi:hypothetical protein